MTMSAGIQWKCPVCGGDFHCKEHWLGWTEDGKTILAHDGGMSQEPFDESKHLIVKTGVTIRVYRRE